MDTPAQIGTSPAATSSGTRREGTRSPRRQKQSCRSTPSWRREMLPGISPRGLGICNVPHDPLGENLKFGDCCAKSMVRPMSVRCLSCVLGPSFGFSAMRVCTRVKASPCAETIRKREHPGPMFGILLLEGSPKCRRAHAAPDVVWASPLKRSTIRLQEVLTISSAA